MNLTHRQVQVVFVGLMAGMLLAALDQTIVATALPTIVGDLGGLRQLSWVVTAYILTSTVSVPLWGKISDLSGRKRIFQSAILIFLLGSALSGLSQNMAELIGFRALQGAGAGGLLACAQAIIGDIVSPRDRDQYAWGSPQIIALGIVGVLALIAFFAVEGKVEEPLILLRLWRNPVFSVATGLEFLVGFAMFGAIIFLPLYLQTVGHASATNSG